MAVFSEKTVASGGRDGVPGLSIIGAGMRVVGDIAADGVVKIEGSVTGTVRAAKQVLTTKRENKKGRKTKVKTKN
jgi:cytoskeletal protein CcmA (bactofilin family)